MSNHVCVTKATLAELFGQVTHSKIIRTTERQDLIAARQNAALSEEERHSIDRLLYGVRRGWLKVIDET